MIVSDFSFTNKLPVIPNLSYTVSCCRSGQATISKAMAVPCFQNSKCTLGEFR